MNKIDNNTARFVKDRIPQRRDLQKLFNSYGFKAALFGTNIFILRNLRESQYEGFVKLLEKLSTHIKKNYIVEPGELIPLTLPWPKALRAVIFEELIASEEAMNQIFERCVFPDGKPLVDLNMLPWIYHNYVVNIASEK
jgi:hypothetical protein